MNTRQRREIDRKNMELEAGRYIEAGMISIRKGQILLSKIKQLSITIITRFFNDEILIPFFLDHYSYADEFIVLLDKGTIDRTREILSRHKNIKIVETEFPYGYSPRIPLEVKQEIINETTTDWIICADVDEFIFPTGFVDVKKVLAETEGDVIYANMWQVYRHYSELPLDNTVKAIHLRRHGPPERGDMANNRMDNKPIVFRSGLNLEWNLGFHSYKPKEGVKVSKTVFDGAHWKMADPELAIIRRMAGRRENVSQEQIDARWAFQDFDITEEEIRTECTAHLNDPQLF